MKVKTMVVTGRFAKVPIHRELIRFGFLTEYVAAMIAKGSASFGRF
jgi:hypothetical protein